MALVDARVGEVPHAGEVEVETLDAGDEHDRVGRRLPVGVVAVAAVGDHAEAPLAGHAAEAEHADGRHELAPRALDRDRVVVLLTPATGAHWVVVKAPRGV